MTNTQYSKRTIYSGIQAKNTNPLNVLFIFIYSEVLNFIPGNVSFVVDETLFYCFQMMI